MTPTELERYLARLIEARNAGKKLTTKQLDRIEAVAAEVRELRERRQDSVELAAWLEDRRAEQAKAAEQAERDAYEAELDAAAAEAEADLRERVATELGCSVDEIEARVAQMEPEPTPIYDHVPDPNGGSRLVPHRPIELETEDEYRKRCAREDAERAEARRRERARPAPPPLDNPLAHLKEHAT